MSRPTRKTMRRARAEDVLPAAERQDMIETKGEKKGMFLSGADYLLSRLPFTKYKYQEWTKTKRIVVGYLLWLIVLPVIPLAIMIIMYVRDPEGFKKSPAFPILAIITAAWFGTGLGYVNSQVPVDASDGMVSRGSLENVKSRTRPAPTNGQEFANCTEAFNAGVYDIERADPAYMEKLDRDGDGLACER